jgi:2-polyprenyl-3-methyl-5-hydroxy-6-metoxy-1,4-benzoquinol methylase
MTPEDRFSERYREGSAPWDIGKPDFNLVQAVKTLPIAPYKAVDIGCGTGDNAIWLAQQNFAVVGVDAAEIAIEKAKEKAARANVTCAFAVLNISKAKINGAPFGFAFDRGCFHTMDSASERRLFAKQISRHLEENGLWLSLIRNADEQRLSEGPPQLTARNIATAVEPYFEILSLISSHFEATLPAPPRNWVCLMRKRVSAVKEKN